MFGPPQTGASTSALSPDDSSSTFEQRTDDQNVATTSASPQSNVRLLMNVGTAVTITARCGSGSSAENEQIADALDRMRRRLSRHRGIERSEASLSFLSGEELECRNSTQVQSCRAFGKAICESFGNRIQGSAVEPDLTE